MNNLKKPLLLIIGLLLLVLFVSVVYSSIFKTDAEPERIRYNESGEVIGKAPFPPSLTHPLGTDKVGNDLAVRMIEGAKYTILFITGVSFLRILVSLIIAYFLVFPFKRISEWVETVFIPFKYIPGLILVLLLSPDLKEAIVQMGFLKIILYQFFLFVFIGIPILSAVLTKESRNVLKNEYIEASNQLGASSWRIYTKHIIPVLKDRLIVTFLQQLSINLLLLIQLGVFQYFIGGSKPGNIAAAEEVVPKYLSESGEWAGMIGQGKDEFLTAPWTFFGPLLISVVFLILTKSLVNKFEDTNRKI